ncbi:MAG: lytic transglycosylase domain-containing protein [Desulfuromonadales bacterium]|nr:lytic transglycosylase domain-containing protein [Desulfuromonadales bacterium]
MRVSLSTCCFSVLFLLLFAGVPTSAQSDIYKYVDANGVIHFTNVPTTSEFKMHRKEGGDRLTIHEVIRHYSRYFRLEEALVRAVIKVESDYNPAAVSRAGAIGMMQLIPKTAHLLKVNDPLDPEQNIRGGSHYLRMMLDQFEGDLDLALAAYNAGPTAVRQHGGVPPYAETIRYLTKVKYYLDYYRSRREVI